LQLTVSSFNDEVKQLSKSAWLSDGGKDETDSVFSVGPNEEDFVHQCT
jgi:hypothetical protein